MRRHLVSRVLSGFAIIGRAQFRSKRLRASAASFALTGSDVTLRLGTLLILEAGAGTFSLTGQTASLLAGRRVAAAAASFALSGQDVTLQKRKTLVAEAASFALSGQVATLKVARRVVAEAASFALTGTAATMRKGLNLAAGAASFALTGQAAGVRVTRKLVADAASFVLTGQTAALRVSRRMAAAAGSFALTGSAATLAKLAYQTPAYANTGGTGDRTAIITATTDMTLASGNAPNLVDGAFTLNGSDGMLVAFPSQSWVGKRIVWDFGTSKLITAMRMHGQVGGFNSGTAVFRGSHDGTTWTTYGSAVTIVSDAGPTEYTELSTNVTGYRYYCLEGATGVANGNVWMVEWEFKIGNLV